MKRKQQENEEWGFMEEEEVHDITDTLDEILNIDYLLKPIQVNTIHTHISRFYNNNMPKVLILIIADYFGDCMGVFDDIIYKIRDRTTQKNPYNDFEFVRQYLILSRERHSSLKMVRPIETKILQYLIKILRSSDLVLLIPEASNPSCWLVTENVGLMDWGPEMNMKMILRNSFYCLMLTNGGSQRRAMPVIRCLSLMFRSLRRRVDLWPFATVDVLLSIVLEFEGQEYLRIDRKTDTITLLF